MTAEPGAAPPIHTDHQLHHERLRVAARAVLDWIADRQPEGLDGSRLDQVVHHAHALVDMRGDAAGPFAAARAHALRVRNELVLVGTDQSLTIAVWFDDALRLSPSEIGVVSVDPAETRNHHGTDRAD